MYLGASILANRLVSAMTSFKRTGDVGKRPLELRPRAFNRYGIGSSDKDAGRADQFIDHLKIGMGHYPC
jgi:hypothetical protein